MDRDLDVFNLLAMVKLFRIMRHIFFSRDQRLFLKFQKEDAIHSDIEAHSSEKSSSDDERRLDELAEINRKEKVGHERSLAGR